MNLLVTNNHILDQAKRIYENFDSRKIPFAAVKLNISLQNGCKNEVDEIVEDNFRRGKDLIFKNNDAYVILMKDTSLETAERATNRLKAGLFLFGSNFQNFPDSQQIQASAHIFGFSNKANRFHIKYLDLSSPLNAQKKTDRIQTSLQEYLRWLELSNNDGYQTYQRINIKI
jgi:hypothetical protein